VARDLLAGRGWSFYDSWRWLRAPLYTLWLAGSLWLADGDLQHAKLPNLLLSVGLVLLVYRLARELSPERRRPALLAAACAALLQTYATFASLYMSETLFSTLFAAGLLALAAWRRRGGLGRAALAGLLLGLACLTRSAALVFLPIAALWLLGLSVQRAGRLRPAALLPGLALALAAAAVIAPWTLRNCRAYGSCILIETGGAYNLWAFYEPRESLGAINTALEAIPNPVERAAEANRRGVARLREDPLIIARKLPDEWVILWGVKPIPDRFLLASAYSDPPPLIFLAALLLDDVLYLLILCAAPFGLALALQRRDSFALLLALWMAVFIAASLLTHTEGRYRHFLFMAMIPLAGLALDALLRRERWARAPALVAAAGLALALVPALGFYPWEWAGRGVLRSLYR
jgi:4-amino-4-deoxy-L-arabinose transferase-like glycosyltransferase